MVIMISYHLSIVDYMLSYGHNICWKKLLRAFLLCAASLPKVHWHVNHLSHLQGDDQCEQKVLTTHYIGC